MKLFVRFYWVLLVILVVISYGFIDPNLHLSANSLFVNIQRPLSYMAYTERWMATVIFAVLLAGLFICYLYFLKNTDKIFRSWQNLLKFLVISSFLLVLSYPALTYDLFNYITTAKVLYTYHENPYVVMPVEIQNEPYLAFTRAANKVALYGPVWIMITALPHYLGIGTIWLTIITFKLANAVVYLGFCWLIFRWTKNLSNVVFFALNPLVLLEVIMNGHNDIYMMILALVALRYRNYFALIASWFIKGATVILTPLIFLKIPWDKMLVFTYWLMTAVFFIIAPIREELYPWYAVWLIAPAALLPYTPGRFLWQFTFVLTFALELRSLPYMWMGYYGGPGPLLRSLVTVIPTGIFLGWYAWTKRRV